jgi:hypothetical protein
VITGNNVEIAGDLTTRGLVMKIDPATENPEERSFDLDLHKEVPARRGELAIAALTIMKAYHVARRPMAGTLSVFGRFEAWSEMVREPLVWLGQPDPYLTKRLLESRDPEREIIANVLQAWDGAFGNEELTAGAVLQAAKDKASPQSPNDPDTELLDAINDALPSRNGVSPRAFGKWLSKHEGRIEGGFVVKAVGEAGKTIRWRVFMTNEPYGEDANVSATADTKSDDSDSGFAGLSGFDSNPLRKERESYNTESKGSAESIGSSELTHLNPQTPHGGEFEI